MFLCIFGIDKVNGNILFFFLFVGIIFVFLRGIWNNILVLDLCRKYVKY